MRASTWMALLVALAWAGCGDDDGGDADGDADADADADADGDSDGDADGDGDGDCSTPPDAPPVAPPRGQVRVTLDVAGTTGSASAVFYESDPFPWHDEVMAEGDCRLLEWEPGGCDNCFDGICRDGECVPYPTARGAGTVTITGDGLDTSLEEYSGTYYGTLEGSFTEGAAVHAAATGDEQPAFTLDGHQPAALEADIENDELHLADGQDAVVTWTPADCSNARVRLTLKTPTAAHGTPPLAMIECDVPDTGSLTIPRAIIEAFPETERRDICVLVDCPASLMTRYTRATTGTGADEVELVVESQRTFAVVHPVD